MWCASSSVAPERRSMPARHLASSCRWPGRPGALGGGMLSAMISIASRTGSLSRSHADPSGRQARANPCDRVVAQVVEVKDRDSHGHHVAIAAVFSPRDLDGRPAGALERPALAVLVGVLDVVLIRAMFSQAVGCGARALRAR